MGGNAIAGKIEEIFLIGRPVVTIFHNPDNLFTIVKLKVRETNCGYEDKEIIVKGNFPQLMLTMIINLRADLSIIRHTVHSSMCKRLRKRCRQRKRDLSIICRAICFRESG